MNRTLLFLCSLAGAAFLALAACSAQDSAVPPATVDRPGTYSENGLPMAPSANSHVLYVMNYDTFSVTEYRFPDFRNAPHIRTIAGPETKIYAPIDLALDGAGYIYVSDRCFRHDALVNVFSPLADGDVAPIRTLHLGLRVCPRGMWVDSAGSIYLAENDRQSRVPEVMVYAPGANGGAHPIRLIAGSNTLLHCPYGATTDAASHLFIADRCTQSILEFSSTADGNIAPVARIKGSKTQLLGPTRVQIGPDGKIYVVDTSNNAPYGLHIFVFPAGADGNVAPITSLSPPNGQYFLGDLATFGPYLIAGTFFGTNSVNIYRTGSPITLLNTITAAIDDPVAEAVH